MTLTRCAVASMVVKGSTSAGGLLGYGAQPIVSRASVDATVSAPGPAGGLCGTMDGGSITESYAKGSVTSSQQQAGGIAGVTGLGRITEDGARISVSYAQLAVTAGTAAGGIIGYGLDSRVEDVYVVGNVTGSFQVGGLVGYEDSVGHGWVLDKGIYRGNVSDRARDWAGTVGEFSDFISRWEGTIFDKNLDQSQNYLVHSTSQKPASTLELKLPTTAAGGVYCGNLPPSTRCGDNTYSDPPWDAGTSSQHHALRNMPGPNSQPR